MQSATVTAVAICRPKGENMLNFLGHFSIKSEVFEGISWGRAEIHRGKGSSTRGKT
jgi:hypothetical protein